MSRKESDGGILCDSCVEDDGKNLIDSKVVGA